MIIAEFIGYWVETLAKALQNFDQECRETVIIIVIAILWCGLVVSGLS